MKTKNLLTNGETPALPGLNNTIRSFLGVCIICISIYGCTPYVQRSDEGVNMQPPEWAPYYDNTSTIRYYYFPDIECYYDVWNREFIYPDDGRWIFSRSLPPAYSWFDLNSSFVVLLDYNVYEPWRHFHYYVSHYPRYYYRSYYGNAYGDNDHAIRGFNENRREAVYRNNPERENRSTVNRRETRNESRNEVNNRNVSRQEPVNNRNEGKQEQINREQQDRRVESTRPPQKIEYYDKQIGQPVKVKKNMKKQNETKRREESRRKEESEK